MTGAIRVAGLLAIAVACVASQVLVASCGGSTGGAGECKVGAQEACACDTGLAGTRTCAPDDGGYTVCSCDLLTSCEKYMAVLDKCVRASCEERTICPACDALENAVDARMNPGENDPENCRKALGAFRCDDITSAIQTACDSDAGAGCSASGEKICDGICLGDNPDSFTCYSTCPDIGTQCEGMDGGYLGACYAYGPEAPNVCMPEGTKAAGESCVARNDCVAGVLCLDLDDGPTCYQVCTGVCAIGECTLTPFGNGISVCKAP